VNSIQLVGLPPLKKHFMSSQLVGLPFGGEEASAGESASPCCPHRVQEAVSIIGLK